MIINIEDLNYHYIFTWEQRKLGDVIFVNSGKDYKQLNVGQIPVYGTGGYITSVNDKLSDEDAIGLGRKGTINKPYMLKAPFWTVDTLFFLTNKKENKLSFLFPLIQRINWLRYDESTGLPSLSKNNIEKVKVSLPKIDEQSRIGQLVSQVNSVLVLYQRKLDLLKQLKQGMLQKLFVDNNSKQPVLRFKKFNGDWKQQKLGEIFSERKQKSANGQLLSVSIARGVYPFDENERKDNSSNDKHNYRLVKVNDIAYNSMRMWQGAEGYSKYEGIVSPAYTVLIPQEGTNSIFFSFMFKRVEMLRTFQAHSQGLTPDTWNLKYPLFKNILVSLPSVQEQKSVSDLLNKLNEVINLYQSKIDILTRLKKFLLQQMFI